MVGNQGLSGMVSTCGIGFCETESAEHRIGISNFVM
jgi:hypothetical protein